MQSADTALVPPATPRVRLATVLRGGLLGATLGTVVVNGAQTALGALATVTLTNVLGPGGYGAYAFAFTWATLLTIPSVLGMTPLIVRHVATYSERSAWGHLRGIVRRSNQVVGVSSVVVAASAAAIAWVAIPSGSDLRTPFLIAMLLVPLVSLITIRQAAMIGLGQPVRGRLPDTVVAPGILLTLLLGAVVVTGGRYSAAAAVVLQVGAAILALWIGARMLRGAIPREARVAAPDYETAIWVRGGLALLLASIAVALQGQVGTIALGALKGSSAAGVFAASVRLAAFASFLFLATSYPIMPVLARQYVKGELADVERLATRAARGVTLVSAPLLCVVVALAPSFLGLLGAGFASGATTLRILVVGEVVRQVTGFGGTVLLMSGRERKFARVAIVGTALNVALVVALVPSLGVRGAALATAAAVVFQNLAMLFVAWRETGVWTAALPLPGRMARAPHG